MHSPKRCFEIKDKIMDIVQKVVNFTDIPSLQTLISYLEK
jgi:hypothetical protein